MSFFRSKTLRGITYDLSHLDPFTFPLQVDTNIFIVHVSFHLHCFTIKLTAGHQPDLRYTYGSEARAFDPERHRLSKMLPEFIRSMGSRSVYWSQQGNFFFWRNPAESYAPYLVFFDVVKSQQAGSDVRVHVRSAYPKPNMALRAAPIRFTTLIEMTAGGKTPKAGPIQQIKRK